MCNPELILAAKPAVNRCQSQSTDFRGTFANFRGTFANFRGTFGKLPGYLWSFLANYRGAFGQLPGYLWQITGVPLVIFGQLPGYVWALPGYLLPTSGVPFAHFRGTFGLLPGYLLATSGVPLAKIRICHEILSQRYPGSCENLLFWAGVDNDNAVALHWQPSSDCLAGLESGFVVKFQAVPSFSMATPCGSGLDPRRHFTRYSRPAG